MITKVGASNYVATCDNCGKVIKNVFQIGDKVYGSECVQKMRGTKPEKWEGVKISEWQANLDWLAHKKALKEAWNPEWLTNPQAFKTQK